MRYTRALIYALFIALSISVIYLASSSWSAEALYLNSCLMPLYFLVTTFLFLIILSDRVPFSIGEKLALILIHSFLTRIVTIIFFYPGTSGDNTYHLAHERTFYIFGKYYYSLLPTTPGEIQSLIGRLFVFQRASIQYGLVTALSKMLHIDVFWIHLSFVGTLWSLFVPIIGFKISKTLGTNDRVALLAGVLAANAPMIIGWSSSSVPNSLGFFFFFVTIYFLLKSLSSQNTSKYIFLTLLATVVSLLTHALTGLATFVVVLLAFSIQKYYSWRGTHYTTASFFLAISFLICVVLIPAASVLMYLVYPTYSSYSLQKIFSYDIYHIVLANYADYTAIQTIMQGTIVILAIIGMIIHSRRNDKKKLNLFMILAFIFIITEYRVNLYFCTRQLFGLSRILTFEPFIIAPFVAITINYLITAAKPALSIPLNQKSSKHRTRFKIKFPLKQAPIILLICLGLSALIVEGDLANFTGLGFRREPYGINSVYSTEAARLIHEEYLRTQEKYAVVSDPVSEGAGMALVGRYNPNEFYLLKYSNLPLFTSLLRDLSTESLLNATQYNGATLVYVIVAKYSVARYLGPKADFDQVMTSLSRLLERFAIVGKGSRQVYVFRFKAEYRTGTGPSVIVYKDLQQVSLNTTYSFMNLETMTYQLNVTGATNYSTTGWPMHWSYEQIRPEANTSIDSNAWINFTGSPTVNYTIEWTANEYYPNVVWKDDSFLQGWRYTGRVSNYSFTTDGDIASESMVPPLNPQDWVNYARELPSHLLQNCSTLLVRLKGDANSKFSMLVWENNTIILSSGHKTATTEFKTYTFTLPSHRTPTRIWISTLTPDGKSATIYWDYIMFVQD